MFNGYVSGGVSSGLAADLAVPVSHQGEGYGRNLDTGSDVYQTNLELALRSKWVWAPTDSDTVHLIFDFERRYGSSATPDYIPRGTYPSDLTSQVMGQLQQGAMNRVRADAARANQQAAAINARREASNAAFNQHMDNLNAQSQSFNAHMDNIDRSSKITQDYILDRSVVRDIENGDRATVSNGYADSLVRANPDRFQVVPNQNLLAGKDY